MGMSKTSTWCSFTRWRSRSSGPSNGGSPGRGAGRTTRKGWAGPGAASAPVGSWALVIRAPPPSEVQVELHGAADLLHRPLRLVPGPPVAVPDHVGDVVRPGEERLPPLAHPLLVGGQALEQL